MSLRSRIFVALLTVALASLAIAWAVARAGVLWRFGGEMERQAAAHFRADVASYYLTYGSWQQAMRSEAFPLFERRRKLHVRDEGGDLDRARPLPPAAEDPVARSPELFGALARRPPTDGHTPQPDEWRPGNGPSAPFRFLLFAPDGLVLMPAGRYRPGDTITPAERENATPVVIDGQIRAYAGSLGKRQLSASDRAALGVLQDNLAWGSGAAAILAALTALALGRRLSRPLLRLTEAVRNMENGQLRQHVDIAGGDEVGELAQAFNRMSDEVADSHARLRQSHATIASQAEQLRELASRDGLTGLFNRRHFDTQAAHLHHQARHQDHPLAVMLSDIDHFKRINDGFSHATGDEVLRRVGAILTRMTRGGDLVGRYGGEEFVIAFPSTTLDEATGLCERLRQAVAEHDWAEIDPRLSVTISIGLSDNRDGDDMDAMLRQADAFLYQAKTNGRNRVCRPAACA